MKILLFVLLMVSSRAFALENSLMAKDLFTQKNVMIDLVKPKTTVVVFLSSVCPCSNGHIEELKKTYANYKDIQFIGVHSNQDEGLKDAQAYFKKANLPFEILSDEKAILANEFKASKTPHAFILNDKKEILYQGGVTDSKDCKTSTRNYVAEALDDIKSNKKIRTTKTRVMGCEISRS